MSEDCEDIPYGTSCRVAGAVGFESANHTELSCLIGKLESNSVPLYPVCEEKKCVDVATSDSSTLAQDCTDFTSGDQCNVMCAVGYTGSASTLTCTLDVVNGSVSFIRSLPNCSAVLYAVDGIPSVMSHDCGKIAFLESCYAICSDGYALDDVTFFFPVLWIQWLSSQRHYAILSRLQSLVLPEQCAPRRRHRGGLGLLLLTFCEVWVVTCAGGYTAAGDHDDVRFRSRTAEHVAGGFSSFMQVGAVRPQHIHAFFHSES